MKSALILEDHAETQRWLVGLVEEAFAGIAIDTASTLERAMQRVAGRDYDIALLDLGLPDGSGLELIADLRRRSPATYTVVTTIFDDDRHLFDALSLGAHGYLLKEQPREEMLEKLSGISRGEPPLSPSVARRVLRYFSYEYRGSDAAAQDDAGLSRREIEVLHLISRGLNRTDIAETLGISAHTAAGYMKSIYRKLHVSGRAEAALEGVRRRLISL